jgi:hypothetical protein
VTADCISYLSQFMTVYCIPTQKTSETRFSSVRSWRRTQQDPLNVGNSFPFWHFKTLLQTVMIIFVAVVSSQVTSSNRPSLRSRATPLPFFVGHFFILTANQTLIFSAGDLPSSCSTLCYMLDAPLFLRPHITVGHHSLTQECYNVNIITAIIHYCFLRLIALLCLLTECALTAVATQRNNLKHTKLYGV